MKLVLALKIGFAAIFFMISSSVYAEYYISPEVGFDCFSGCYFECYHPCSHYMHFSSPYRYDDRGSGQVEEYAWIGPGV